MQENFSAHSPPVHLSEWVHGHIIQLLYVHVCLCASEIIMSDCLNRTSVYEYSAV